MEGQSVVLRAEKGKLRLRIDGEEGGKAQEMVYEVNPGEEKEGGDGEGREGGGEDGAAGRRGEKAEELGANGRREVPGGVGAVDGAEEAGRDLPGDGGGVGEVKSMAGPGDGGDALGFAASGPGGEEGGLINSLKIVFTHFFYASCRRSLIRHPVLLKTWIPAYYLPE